MKVLFTKSKWEMWDDSLESFLQRAAADRFDAVEIYLPAQPESARDWFSFEENLRIFNRACELSRASGLTFTHETHRSRPTGSAPETTRYLQALPELRLNTDFSHWFCVHESDLSDQPAAVELAIARASHIHARVGFEEGPQVPDPLNPLWSRWTQLHLALWQRIIAARRAEGAAFLTITPEFGPPPYMPVDPRTNHPLADAWETNVRFRNWLQQNLPT